uniref:Plexin-B1 n=1 Tax=Scleropages formosus TaxID=113540 RepID=A0A8C9WH95_SCLFO
MCFSVISNPFPDEQRYNGGLSVPQCEEPQCCWENSVPFSAPVLPDGLSELAGLNPPVPVTQRGEMEGTVHCRSSSNVKTSLHLALHPDLAVGAVYVGAKDRLFQLDKDLRLLKTEETGPVTDSKECLPPITESNCPQARRTSNHNKLLLVDPYSQELITCGSVNQGICQKRSLESVSHVLFSTERPVDTQYVAANDPNVTTVGLVVRSRGRQPVLFVGRGYTSSHPPISTRNLAFEPVFSYEETAKLAVAGRLSEYDHHFVTAFSHRSHVYFLFYRRDLKSQSREYRTYVSRVCLDDASYYSYVEVPLACHRGNNFVQGQGGEREVLLGVFATRMASSNRPSEDSALCMFHLDELDQQINSTRDLCYTRDGRDGGAEAAYIEYEVKSNCNTLDAYPCGSDHTPSPMASRVSVEAEPILDSPSARLTAVAVSVRANHTIAFLGDSKGNLHKTLNLLSSAGQEYDIIPIQPGAAISGDLFLDQAEEHLFVMTASRVPVAECYEHLDCQSCLSAHDPYCGWCVLSGRCGRLSDCPRAHQPGQWLWSFDMEQQCLTVQTLSPSNISREERKNIVLSVPGLPSLEEKEVYSCYFGDYESPAALTDTGVACSSPDTSSQFMVPDGSYYVTVTLSLRFLNVTVAATDFVFYDCSAVKHLSGTMPCRGCVTSRWSCNWCILQHLCTHKPACEDGIVIYNERVSLQQTLTLSTVRAAVEYNAMVYVKRRNAFHVDSSKSLYGKHPHPGPPPPPGHGCPFFERRGGKQMSANARDVLTLYNCSVGRSDCSRCHTADRKYGCVWCGGPRSECLHRDSCTERVEQTCPAPLIHFIEPLSGLVEGGTAITISGSNLGQKAQDIQHSVTVAGIPCTVIPNRYEVSSRIVCETSGSGEEKTGQVSVEVSGGAYGFSSQKFSYLDPLLKKVSPQRGPKAGGTSLTLTGRNLRTGRTGEIGVVIGTVPCLISSEIQQDSIECVTGSSNITGAHKVTVRYGNSERHLQGTAYYYTSDPNITQAAPSKIWPRSHFHDLFLKYNIFCCNGAEGRVWCFDVLLQFEERCHVNSSTLLLCRTPAVETQVHQARVQVHFLLDNLRFDFRSISTSDFTYELNPILHPLNKEDPNTPFRYKPGSVISVEGENLDLAIYKEEVVAMIGEGVCSVKTLTRNHLYCEPPPQQPSPGLGKKREGTDSLPEFTVQMGNLNFSLGKVQYDTQSQSTFPLEAQIGVGVGASIVALIVLIIVLIYRRKSKQALRDYKKVQIQLENLETSVRDRCKKEFTDLMTEMMDMSSDLVGSGIPFLDYRMYAERIFFPGHRESPLRRDLDVQECRRQTVEQGLVQLSNLLNSKLFLTKFIHTLESQRTFSPRDRAYVASLLTVALHGKLEYFTDILKTLLNDLVEQYVAKNPKLMLRRTETVVEKLLTNWMSICLYAFLRDSAGESLYMLFRAIKHQVDKGPVDAVTGKAKYTLNDNRLLREDIEYHTLTLNVLMQGGMDNEAQPVPAKVLDCDTITQVKEKILDQVYKGTPFSHRPHTDSLDLEWRSGVAGHLILSDEDLTSVVQGRWKRLNTLQHYKVSPGKSLVLLALQSCPQGETDTSLMTTSCLHTETPMLEDADEGGVRLWHLVKASEEAELPRHRRGSLRERERAKAIPEIYLTRLLSMKGTLQKFVDDLFQVILSTSRPVPLAVKYFFDLLDDQATHHGISDSETIHIWKTNSLPLRFWINIVKNPQFIFDVQASDNVDAVLSVIAQTFMDSCTIAEHKLGRDSPINKLLYARDIPRYKQMVERYYADIRQTISASDQEMNSALAELSRNYSGELNYLVALHELYKYINKYYDQIITALEEDTTAQKMQLGYRLQQIAAAVENKVTDL